MLTAPRRRSPAPSAARFCFILLNGWIYSDAIWVTQSRRGRKAGRRVLPKESRAGPAEPTEPLDPSVCRGWLATRPHGEGHTHALGGHGSDPWTLGWHLHWLTALA